MRSQRERRCSLLAFDLDYLVLHKTSVTMNGGTVAIDKQYVIFFLKWSLRSTAAG